MMYHKQIQAWISQVDELSTAQRKEAKSALSGSSQASASLAAIEAGVGEDRQCPHCGAAGAISRGKARGLRRYQCKGCGKTFNAATGTPLAGLHRKERWLEFGNCLADGETVRASARGAAGLASTRPSAGGTGSLPPKTGIHESSPALQFLTHLTANPATLESARLTGERAAGESPAGRKG